MSIVQKGALDRLAQGDVVRTALGPTGSDVLTCRAGQAALGQRCGHWVSGRARGFELQHQGLLHATQLLDFTLGEGPRQFFGTHGVHVLHKQKTPAMEPGLAERVKECAGAFAMAELCVHSPAGAVDCGQTGAA